MRHLWSTIRKNRITFSKKNDPVFKGHDDTPRRLGSGAPTGTCDLSKILAPLTPRDPITQFETCSDLLVWSGFLAEAGWRAAAWKLAAGNLLPNPRREGDRNHGPIRVAAAIVVRCSYYGIAVIYVEAMA